MSVTSRSAIERVVLTGFMGSGKTTLGRLLAARLGWTFLDLDDEVIRRTGVSVSRMFAEMGEAAFRKKESAALRDTLLRSRLVLALGGGVPEAAANRRLLTEAAATEILYLRAEFAVLQARCTAEAAAGAAPRPLFEDAEQAQLRFLRREPLYRGIATLEVDASELPPDALVERILPGLRSRLA